MSGIPLYMMRIVFDYTGPGRSFGLGGGAVS